MRVLLDWIPSIHLVAPGIEYNGSLKDAHKCLIYAAKTMKWLDQAERGWAPKILKLFLYELLLTFLKLWPHGPGIWRRRQPQIREEWDCQGMEKRCKLRTIWDSGMDLA